MKRYHTWSCLFILCFVFAAVVAKPLEQTLRVGISLGLEAPANDTYAFVQRYAHEGLMIWQDAFNNMSVEARTTKDGKVISFELIVFENFGRFSYNNPSHETFMREQIVNMSRDTSLDFVLPPVGSPWGTVLRNASLLTGRVPFTIGIADSREFWYRLPGSYGAPTSTLNVMASALPFLKTGGAKTSYVIRMQETFQAELCQGFINHAPYQKIAISHVENVPFNYNTFGVPTSDADFAMWSRVVDDVIAKKDDVLVICDYGEASQYVIGQLKQRNYTPKAILLSYKYAEFKDASLAEFVIVPRSYHPDTNYPAQENFVDSVDYNKIVVARYGHIADYNNAQATLAGFLLSNAILKSTNSSDHGAIERALFQSQFASFMGRASFDTERRQLLENAVVQTQGGIDVVIGPLIASRTSVVYPMPTWEERTYKPKWGHSAEIAGLVMMSIGVVMSLGWFIFLVVHWRDPVIMGASPLFCALILLGSVLIFASNVVWMPNLANHASCTLRAWLLPLGFVLLFGALIAKTNRIHRIFQVKHLQVTMISDWQVMLIVLCLLVGQIALSAIMAFAGNITSTVHVVDVWRPSLSFRQCASNAALKYLYGINIACMLLLLGYGSYLAWQVHKIPMRMYDESRLIHFATYTTFVFGVIGLIVCVVQSFVGSSFRFVTYILLSICMFAGPSITVGMLFYSKVRAIYFPSNSHSTNSSGGTITTGSASTGRHGHYGASKATAPRNPSGAQSSDNENFVPSPTSSKTPGSPTSARSVEMKSVSPIAAESSKSPRDPAMSQDVEWLQREVTKLRKRLDRMKRSRSAEPDSP